MTHSTYTYNELKAFSGEELNRMAYALEEEIERVRAAYRAAADRETAKQAEALKLIGFIFRSRGWQDS